MDLLTLFSIGSTIAGGLGSMGAFGGGSNKYDQLIDDILSGKTGGIPQDVKDQLSASFRKNITSATATQRARTAEDFQSRGLTQSGLLSNAYQDINEQELQQLSDADLAIMLKDIESRNSMLSQVLGMGNPYGGNQDAWGQLFGAGLGGLMQSFDKPKPKPTGGG